MKFLKNIVSSIKQLSSEVMEEADKINAEKTAQERAPLEALNEQFVYEWSQFTELVQYGILAQAMFKEFLYGAPQKVYRFDRWRDHPTDKAVFYHYRVHPKEEVTGKAALAKEWSILSAEDFEEKVHWVLEHGQTNALRGILGIYREAQELGVDPISQSAAETRKFLDGKMEDGFIDALTKDSVREKLLELQTHGLLRDAQEFDFSGLAFDLGRISVLHSDAHAMGWTTREELLKHFSDLGKLVLLHFKTWEEFGQDFMLGARFWMPSSIFRDINIEWYHETIKWLQLPENPWSKVPLPALPARENFLSAVQLNYPDWYSEGVFVFSKNVAEIPVPAFFFNPPGVAAFGYDWRGRTYFHKGAEIEIVDPVLGVDLQMEYAGAPGDRRELVNWVQTPEVQNEVLEYWFFLELLFWNDLFHLPAGAVFKRKPYERGENFYDHRLFEVRGHEN